MRALILLITGCVIGFLLGFIWKSMPAAEEWAANREHFWTWGGRPGGAAVRGLTSGRHGTSFVEGESDERRVLVRAYAIAPGQTRVVVAQWRPDGKKMPAVELAKEVSMHAKAVSREGGTALPVQYAGKPWVLSVDIYRVDADNLILTGDDFLNLPQRVYFDGALYHGLKPQPAS